MKRLITIISALAIVAPSHAQVRPQRAVKIFNGKDLSGWKGDASIWSAGDGILTGNTDTNSDTAQISSLEFSGGPVNDFELKLKARFTGTGSANIGYRGNYRFAISPKLKISGSISETGRCGILARRGVHARASASTGQSRIIGTIQTPDKIELDAWNDITIIARGNRLIHKINGEITSTLVDDDPERRSLEGLLSLQIDAGSVAKFELKDIVLRRYNRAHISAPKNSATAIDTGTELDLVGRAS